MWKDTQKGFSLLPIENLCKNAHCDLVKVSHSIQNQTFQCEDAHKGKDGHRDELVSPENVMPHPSLHLRVVSPSLQNYCRFAQLELIMVCTDITFEFAYYCLWVLMVQNLLEPQISESISQKAIVKGVAILPIFSPKYLGIGNASAHA